MASALRRQLRPPVDGLARHRAFGERVGGVFAEIEVALGHGHELATERRLHRSAVQQAKELFDALGTAVGGLSPDEVRARGHRLVAAAIRFEADLLLLLFDQDTSTAG